jgi:RNA-binding protein
MSELTSRQRAILRSLAHSLKPVTNIGKDGVTESLTRTVTEALRTRELLKVKVLETAPGSVDELGGELASSVPGTHLVQVIGRTIVLYRRHPEKPVITLPGA